MADVNRRRLHVFTGPRGGAYENEADVAPGVTPLPNLDASVDLADAI